jgi:hypothetical protein
MNIHSRVSENELGKSHCVIRHAIKKNSLSRLCLHGTVMLNLINS